MAMFISNKKLVFQSFFLFQTTFAFFNNDDYVTDNEMYYRAQLEKIFGHNVCNITEVGVVLVWKVSTGQKIFRTEDYSRGFIEFGADETFLIFTQNWTSHFTLYYWIGTETTLEDKKHVARYAATFFILMTNYRSYTDAEINFAREDQIFESESFVHTINRLRSKSRQVDGRIGVYRDIHFPLNGPNLYLVKDDSTKISKIVPIGLGLQLLIYEICLVVETPPHIKKLYPATAYCVEGVNEMIRWRAQSLVRRICQIVDGFIVHQLVARGSLEYKALVELLENKEYHRSSETDYIKDGNKVISNQEEGMLLFEFSMSNVDGEWTMSRQLVRESPIDIDNIDDHNNYLLDTKSVAGIFFVYSDKANMKETLRALQNAEEYLHEQISLLARPIRMKVSPAHSSKFPIDFDINALPPRIMTSFTQFANNDCFHL